MISRSHADRAMLAISLLTMGLSYLAEAWWCSATAVLMFAAWLGVRISIFWRARRQSDAASSSPQPAKAVQYSQSAAERDPLDAVEVGGDTSNLIEELLAEGRYALLLRPQIVDNLTEGQLTRGLTALDEEMAMIAAGSVAVRYWRAQEKYQEQSDDLCAVAPYFLDRYPVTNAQFQRFVQSGAYDQASLWDPEIWPSVEQFVDLSGEPGPRFWQSGQFPSGQEQHPVVGVNWYEARAYANWMGKRLPTDAEWVKAAAWPVQSGGRRPIQRRYPWGESMNRECALLWSHQTQGPVAVHATPAGSTPDAVHQLIGNVWEWMHGDFGAADLAAGVIDFSAPMKSIRGGAFDTYFDGQAATQFQSGECVLSRKHNVGFRCIVGVADLAMSADDPASEPEPLDYEDVADPQEAV